MGAFYIADLIRKSPNVSNIAVKSQNEFQFDYETQKWGKRNVRVYVPTIEEYKINIDVVNKAIGLGATVIAYDAWAEVTAAAKLYAESQSVRIYKGNIFSKVVLNGGNV